MANLNPKTEHLEPTQFQPKSDRAISTKTTGVRLHKDQLEFLRDRAISIPDFIRQAVDAAIKSELSTKSQGGKVITILMNCDRVGEGEVSFSAVTTGNDEEIKKHFEATPFGEAAFAILKDAAIAQLEEGKIYKFSIEPYQSEDADA